MLGHGILVAWLLSVPWWYAWCGYWQDGKGRWHPPVTEKDTLTMGRSFKCDTFTEAKLVQAKESQLTDLRMLADWHKVEARRLHQKANRLDKKLEQAADAVTAAFVQTINEGASQ